MSERKQARRTLGTTIPRPKIIWVLWRQAIILLVVAAGLFGAGLTVEAKSFLAGGLIHVVPQAVFAMMVFLYMGARNIKKAYASSSQGLATKILLTAVALIYIFRNWPEVSLIALFIGYLFLQISSWILYPILINRPPRGGK